MIPVLFLDVDGVLNCASFIQRLPSNKRDLPQHQLDPRAVAKIEHVRRATGCRIVLSSSWRIGDSLEVIARWLREAGLCTIVRDATPVLSKERGLEIQAWLDAHEDEGPFRVAIIDDDSDMVHLRPYHVKTNYFGAGLEDAHVGRLVRLLTEGPFR